MGRSQPISRVLSWTAIHLGRTSQYASCDLPGSRADHTCETKLTAPLFGLAPDGVCPATSVTGSAVRSYRTISPLPEGYKARWRYIFCGTFRRLAPPRRYLASCPAEPGLSSLPTHRPEQRLSGQLQLLSLVNRWLIGYMIFYEWPVQRVIALAG